MTFKKINQKLTRNMGAVITYIQDDKELKYIQKITSDFENESFSQLTMPFTDKNKISKINIQTYFLETYMQNSKRIEIATNMNNDEKFLALIAWSENGNQGVYSFLDNKPVWEYGFEEGKNGLVANNPPMPKEIGDQFREFGKKMGFSENIEECLKSMEATKFYWNIYASGSFN